MLLTQKELINNDESFFGGAGGSRTPVQKPIPTGISERSQLFKIPLYTRQLTNRYTW